MAAANLMDLVAVAPNRLASAGPISTKRPEPDGSAATIDRPRRQKPES
jgi:hypothetical protein